MFFGLGVAAGSVLHVDHEDLRLRPKHGNRQVASEVAQSESST
jgi:hypothetical protein